MNGSRLNWMAHNKLNGILSNWMAIDQNEWITFWVEWCITKTNISHAESQRLLTCSRQKMINLQPCSREKLQKGILFQTRQYTVQNSICNAMFYSLPTSSFLLVAHLGKYHHYGSWKSTVSIWTCLYHYTGTETSQLNNNIHLLNVFTTFVGYLNPTPNCTTVRSFCGLHRLSVSAVSTGHTAI